eukprot:Protomagalhaensia_sp_Gyna_25__167@NODE_107_length_5213_cov_41_744105_g84_i0_p2_GENE_NODE_107_length_5213_cov_41_744105_g84_i0NODE_107_length_5213_cov_41_744105_g84_i0_p2_ORF_typecomplete_len506_score83_65Plus3/PF03126_18/2_2e07_NODE_107_length_5213_cov_41_744105_g84_i010792596
MSSDEDDDKPLGAFQSSRRLQSDNEGFDSDASVENRRKRHARNARVANKRPLDESGSGNEGGRSWKRPRDEPLFADTSKSGVDRKLEKAVSEISLDLIESVRLHQALLLHILEHPRAKDFIVGSYVRYPDLEKVEADGVPPEEAPLLPAQITKLVPLKTPEKARTAAGNEAVCNHQMTILQYTQRFDKSLKVRKSKLNIEHINNEPFEMRELEQWRELLKLFSGKAGADKLQALPQMLLETAERLKSFTFTDEDVNAILQMRLEQQEGLARLSAGQTLNWRDLYLKKAELEFTIQELTLDPDLPEEAAAKLEQTQAELVQVKHNLEILRKEEGTTEEPSKLMEIHPVLPPSATVNRGGRRPVPTPATGNDVSVLTPRFLQQKSAQGAAGSRVIDWRALECAQHYSKVSWGLPNGRFDALYRPSHLNDHEEWSVYKERLRVRLRGDTLGMLVTRAEELCKAQISFEKSTLETTCPTSVFRLPFPGPQIKPDREIIQLPIKAQTGDT